jgi:hypothetical protein
MNYVISMIEDFYGYGTITADKLKLEGQMAGKQYLIFQLQGPTVLYITT